MAGPRHPPWYHSKPCTKCDYLSTSWFDSDLCVYHRGERPPVCELLERPAMGWGGPRHPPWCCGTWRSPLAEGQSPFRRNVKCFSRREYTLLPLGIYTWTWN